MRTIICINIAIFTSHYKGLQKGCRNVRKQIQIPLTAENPRRQPRRHPHCPARLCRRSNRKQQHRSTHRYRQTQRRPKRRGRRVLQKRLQRLCRQRIPRTLPRPIRRRRAQRPKRRVQHEHPHRRRRDYAQYTRHHRQGPHPRNAGRHGADGRCLAQQLRCGRPKLSRSRPVPQHRGGEKPRHDARREIGRRRRDVHPYHRTRRHHSRRKKLGNRSQNRVFRQHRGAEKRLAPILRPRLPHPLAHRRDGGRGIGYARCINRLYRQTFPHRPVVGRRHRRYEVCGRQKPHQLQRRQAADVVRRLQNRHYRRPCRIQPPQKRQLLRGQTRLSELPQQPHLRCGCLLRPVS